MQYLEEKKKKKKFKIGFYVALFIFKNDLL